MVVDIADHSNNITFMMHEYQVLHAAVGLGLIRYESTVIYRTVLNREVVDLARRDG